MQRHILHARAVNASSHGYSEYTRGAEIDKTKRREAMQAASIKKPIEQLRSETNLELSPLRREKRRDGLVQILIRRNEG